MDRWGTDMISLFRWISLAAAAAVLTATPGLAVGPAQNATGTARIVKPLTLQWQQDLDLGTIILNSGAWTGATVSISPTGTFNCDGGASTKVTCTNATKPAQYKVTGTNNQDVKITAPDITLTGPSGTLLMTVSRPGSPVGTINLGNSGAAGLVFGLGGSITLNSTTPDGTYTGTFNVTVDY
jgi:hypothetical protein